METQNETVRKVLLLYQARHPGLEILDAEMDEKDPDVVHVIAAGRKAKLLYDRKARDIIIVEEHVYANDIDLQKKELSEKEYIDKALALYKAENPQMTVSQWNVVETNPRIVLRIIAEKPSTAKIVIDVAYDVETGKIVYFNRGKGKVTSFLAMMLTIAYAFYLLYYFAGIGVDTLSGYLAVSIVSNHMICVIVAACFSFVGFFAQKRWIMLVSGILMAVSIAMFPAYFQMVVVQTILFFIAYARMKA